MTMIDPTTGWFELASLQNGPTAAEAQRLLDSVWLAWYPRPREIGFDGGSEFKAEFRELCINMELKQNKATASNFGYLMKTTLINKPFPDACMPLGKLSKIPTSF